MQKRQGLLKVLAFLHFRDFSYSPIFLYTRKPRVRRVVQKRLAGEAERKTPFAIMRLRSSAAIEKAKGGHSKWD